MNEKCSVLDRPNYESNVRLLVRSNGKFDWKPDFHWGYLSHWNFYRSATQDLVLDVDTYSDHNLGAKLWPDSVVQHPAWAKSGFTKPAVMRLNIPEHADPLVDEWVGSYITIETGETYIITAIEGNWLTMHELSWIEKLEWKFMRLKWWQIILGIFVSMVVGGVLTVSGILWYTSLIP